MIVLFIYSWVKKLGKNIISESVLVEVENCYKVSYGELIVFGFIFNVILSIIVLDVDVFG